MLGASVVMLGGARFLSPWLAAQLRLYRELWQQKTATAGS